MTNVSTESATTIGDTTCHDRTVKIRDSTPGLCDEVDYVQVFVILHSCACDGRSTLTLALFHPQFGESSSVSLGNPTSIAHLDHLEEDQGRILIASCDLRSRKAPFKKTTS
ncbi:hypothetical protein PRIPAC_77771 [Pristionchus pacificus]|uniref:Uncharacterized protein n=1 Tax=Pristionchus pacificus TaxID=54126 RepID=A0A2A6C4D7_PRIPA|nr:hypothetical protein PRIPAC_77771 [Pristionchus pacificus]|eukprot:PDM72990.1 hypothetical protein PRIPAC_39424 [Pristionchus pacificus]